MNNECEICQGHERVRELLLKAVSTSLYVLLDKTEESEEAARLAQEEFDKYLADNPHLLSGVNQEGDV